jgi:signal peptidase
MTPNIEINDIILVKKCDIRELEKDDIITFTKEKKVISHRIVKVIGNDDDRMFITKGDNNKIEDDGFVEENQIIGKVIFTIPKIGKLVMYIQEKNGFIPVGSHYLRHL